VRTVEYRPRAAFDLESIVVYVGEAQGAPRAAKRLYGEIISAVDLLSEMPTLGRRIKDDALSGEAYRWYLSGQYRIFYTYDEDTLLVWRIIHVRQDIDDYAMVEW